MAAPASSSASGQFGQSSMFAQFPVGQFFHNQLAAKNKASQSARPASTQSATQPAQLERPVASSGGPPSPTLAQFDRPLASSGGPPRPVAKRARPASMKRSQANASQRSSSPDLHTMFLPTWEELVWANEIAEAEPVPASRPAPDDSGEAVRALDELLEAEPVPASRPAPLADDDVVNELEVLLGGSASSSTEPPASAEPEAAASVEAISRPGRFGQLNADKGPIDLSARMFDISN